MTMTKEEFKKQIVEGIKSGELDPCNGVEFGEIYSDLPQYYWTVEDGQVVEESPFYVDDEQPEFRFGITVADIKGIDPRAYIFGVFQKPLELFLGIVVFAGVSSRPGGGLGHQDLLNRVILAVIQPFGKFQKTPQQSNHHLIVDQLASKLVCPKLDSWGLDRANLFVPKSGFDMDLVAGQRLAGG